MKHIDLHDMQAFQEGTMTAQEKTKFMEHIAHCDSCAELFARNMLNENTISPPKGLSEQIIREDVKKEKQRKFYIYTAKVTIAASICLFVLAGNTFFQPKENQSAIYNSLTEITDVIRTFSDKASDKADQNVSKFDESLGHENKEDTENDQTKK